MNYLSISPVISAFIARPGRQFSAKFRARFRVLVAGSLVIFMLAGCAGQDETDVLIRDVTEAYEKAQSSMANGNYRKAIQIFEGLQSRFPFSDLSKQIQLELMYAYYMSGGKEQAIDAAEQFLRENPTHPRVDYALYIQGLTYFDDEAGFLERRFKKSTDGRPPRDADLAFSTCIGHHGGY